MNHMISLNRERMIEYADTVVGTNKKGVDIKPKQSDLIMPRINGKINLLHGLSKMFCMILMV